jgi:APA family basic amino acid/polyamine antiporter
MTINIASEEKLIRAVGLPGIIALTINGIIGAAIFVMPANVAKILGTSSPIAFIGAGILSMIIAACFAELGGKFDRTGGAYLYASEAYSGAFAFVVGWMFFLGRLTSVAALSNALAGFAGYFVNTASPVRELLITSVLALLGIVNILGIRLSAGVISVLTIIKLIALLTFISVGIVFVKWDVFSTIKFPPVGDLTSALLLVMFAFSGFEVIAVPGAEIINPKRNLPLGLLIGTGITMVIYLLIQIVAVGAFPGLASSKAPLAEASELFMGAKGGLLVGAGAVFSTIGTLISILLVGPRILYAMSLNRQMPHFFSKIHPQYRTPYLAIGFFTILGIVWSLSSTFQDLATLSAMTRLITYIGTAVALLILRKKLPSPDTFRMPGGVITPVVAILLSVFLLTAATKKHIISGSIALAVGVILYLLTLRSGKRS